MILQELKKIWTPMRIVLLIVISLLMYQSFLSPIIKRFEAGEGNHAFQEKLCIAEEWLTEYGATVETGEFAEIKSRYDALIAETESSMEQKSAFAECNVKNYREFLEYQTKALNGEEGFDYGKYREMNQKLFEGTPYSSVYLQEYEKMIKAYENTSGGRIHVLPGEVILYSSTYLICLSLWCLIAVLLVSAPVMANDAASNMNMEQYSSRIGRKIYRIQYLCTMISVLFAEAAVMVFGLGKWKKTGAFVFGNAGNASFLYSTEPVIHLTLGEVFGLFVAIMGFMGIGVGSMAFVFSSCSKNLISMLIKVTPLAVAAGAYLLSLDNAFYENNPMYHLTHIPGIELLTGILLCSAGIMISILRYKQIGRSDCIM